MNFKKIIFVALIAILPIFSYQILAMDEEPAIRYLVQNRPLPVEKEELIKRMELPKNIRSIYLTANTFATKRGDELIDELIKSGGNAIVVDVELGGGRLAFEPKSDFLRGLNPGSTLLNDFAERIQQMHDKGIYVIGRQIVFNDPYMSARQPNWRIKNKWGGLFDANWVDPSSSAVQNYNLYVMQELAEFGFDEVQFDYIRFPAANHQSLDYAYDESQFTRVDVINGFLAKARRIADYYDLKISADVFGVIVWGDIDWRIVGQDPETIPDYLDAIYPMTYPSHYSPGFYQHPDPWNKPYDIIYNSIDRFVKASAGRAHIRTWIQGFPLKVNYFGTWFMEEQIKASFDAGATGFAVWSPGNHYGYTFPAINIEASDKGCEMDSDWYCITYDINTMNYGPRPNEPIGKTVLQSAEEEGVENNEEPDWLK